MGKTESKDLHLEILERVSSARAAADLLEDMAGFGNFERHSRDLPALLRSIIYPLVEAEDLLTDYLDSVE